MRWWLLALPMVLACGNDSTDSGDELSLVGSWTWQMAAADAGSGVVCAATGRLTFTQSNAATFSQVEGGCEGEGAPASFGPEGSVSVVVGGRTVSYSADACDYVGEIEGTDPVERVAGTVECVLSPTVTLEGTWEMTP